MEPGRRLVWEEILEKSRTIDAHYSMLESQQEEIFNCLKDIPEGAVIVELGVCHGKTFYILSEIARSVGGEAHGVDHFGLEGTAQEVRQALDSLGAVYTIHESTTQALAWDKQIDVLLVDAGHDEANVSADCAKWIPFVGPGGIVIFHDWFHDDDERDSNAHWAIAWYGKRACAGWIDLQKDNPIPGTMFGLRMWRKPTENQHGTD